VAAGSSFIRSSQSLRIVRFGKEQIRPRLAQQFVAGTDLLCEQDVRRCFRSSEIRGEFSLQDRNGNGRLAR
jgi:hypothetical protein